MEGTYAVRIEEVLGDDCRCAVNYFTNLDESYADRFLNNVVHTGHPSRHHPGRHHTGRNHRLLDIGHRDIDHGLRQIAVGCLIGIGRPRGNNHCLVADDPMTMDACYPYYGRIDDRPGVARLWDAWLACHVLRKAQTWASTLALPL